MHKKHSVQLDRQKQRELMEALKKINQENLRLRQHHYYPYSPIHGIIPGQNYLMNYHNLGLKLDYHPEMKSGEDDDGQGYGDALDYGRTFAGADEVVQPIPGFHGKWMEGGRENTARPAAIGETMVAFRFDKSNLEDRHPFAVKPNDPRYYSDAPFSSGKYIYIYIYTPVDTRFFLVLEHPAWYLG